MKLINLPEKIKKESEEVHRENKDYVFSRIKYFNLILQVKKQGEKRWNLEEDYVPNC